MMVTTMSRIFKPEFRTWEQRALFRSVERAHDITVGYLGQNANGGSTVEYRRVVSVQSKVMKLFE